MTDAETTAPQVGETWRDRRGREWRLCTNPGDIFVLPDYAFLSEDGKHAWTAAGRYYAMEDAQSHYDLTGRVKPHDIIKIGGMAMGTISNNAPQLDALGATLAARAATHGEYLDHARVTQELKAVIRSGPSYENCTDHERETLDMIAHKIGRIVSGNPHFTDHWHDIAGYARLSEDRNK